MAESPSTRKVQITVPTADTSVIEWLDLQYSVSESVRRLIRESVAREGFVDVANRPVRPPAHPVHIADELPPEREPHGDDTRPSPPSPRREDADVPKPPADEPPADEPAEDEPAEVRRPASSTAAATIDDLLGL